MERIFLLIYSFFPFLIKVIAGIFILLGFVYFYFVFFDAERYKEFNIWMYKKRVFSGKIVGIARVKENRNLLHFYIQQDDNFFWEYAAGYSFECQKYIQLGDSVWKKKGDDGVFIKREGNSIFCEYLFWSSYVDRNDVFLDEVAAKLKNYQ